MNHYRNGLLDEIDEEDKHRKWYYEQLDGLQHQLDNLHMSDTVSTMLMATTASDTGDSDVVMNVGVTIFPEKKLNQLALDPLPF